MIAANQDRQRTGLRILCTGCSARRMWFGIFYVGAHIAAIGHEVAALEAAHDVLAGPTQSA
jgi:hypothetical protein